ncbi:hypothetical protein AB0N38_30055 [Micromonospora aurantiaca]|uniref:hypothetical protein n=1 Tax=Micromonospora aurantiaca (nom. illeg.) TaxID=47850 RepID=UPI001E598C8B|nr:hypothetical protein [Micromonospora aurantiaca]UFN92449.1 hypothetical protein LF814_20825 [Micromonospora aurantiaca]
MGLRSIKERYPASVDRVTRDEHDVYADKLAALPERAQLAIYQAALEGRDLVQLVEASELEERLRALPEQTRQAIHKAASEGGDLEELVAAAEAAAQECGQFNCLDENDCCKHCGEHFSGPCAPGCKHYDGGPADECDARPADVA